MNSRALRSICASAFALCLGCQGEGATSGAGGATTFNSGASVTSASGSSTGQGSSTVQGSSSGQGGSTAHPQVGAHGLSYFRSGENALTAIDSPMLTTNPSGSTIIVSVGRGQFDAFAPPSDNKGNAPFEQLGSSHVYNNYPNSGTALYGFTGAAGGPGHVITNTTAAGDEITLAAVEVANGSHVEAAEWVERLDGQSITSAPVTTTGPATLVAFWWGDAGVDGDKVATPNNGFVVIDSIGQAGALVQCFVAAKEVAAAGTYEVTWSATPSQGAQLWLVAVQ